MLLSEVPPMIAIPETGLDPVVETREVPLDVAVPGLPILADPVFVIVKVPEIVPDKISILD